MKNFFCALSTLSIGLFLALSPSLTAQAHVSAEASSTTPGSFSVVTFSIPHGCSGSPTIELRIDIPESVSSVTPTVNPNWSISTTPNQVIYTAIGAGLAADHRDTVALSLRLPEGKPGDTVVFPTHQKCTEGKEDWIGTDAPTVTLTAALPVLASNTDPLARIFGVASLAFAGVALVLALRKKVGKA